VLQLASCIEVTTTTDSSARHFIHKSALCQADAGESLQKLDTLEEDLKAATSAKDTKLEAADSDPPTTEPYCADFKKLGFIHKIVYRLSHRSTIALNDIILDRTHRQRAIHSLS